jgi:hypothetical protein
MSDLVPELPFGNALPRNFRFAGVMMMAKRKFRVQCVPKQKFRHKVCEQLTVAEPGSMT